MSESILVKIAKNVKLREGSEGVKSFFRVVYQNQGISTKETAKQMRIPIPIVAAIKQEAIKEGLVEPGSTLRVTEKGNLFCKEDLGLMLHQSRVCDNCKGLKYMVPDDLRELESKFESIIKNRPIVDVTVDQAHATVKTSIRRAVLALEKGLLFNKRIALMGDDDYISLAIMLLWQELYDSNGPELVVFDIDQRILNHLDTLAENLNYNLTTVYYDARDQLKEEFINRFDVVFTDPPYTVNGADLFVKRANQLLINEIGKTLVFSFGQKAPLESWEVQNRIIKHGFSIEEVILGFNEYLGAAILGSVGQLMVLIKSNLNQEIEEYETKDIYTRQK